MAPGVLVARLQAEREGIADDRDALARGAAREDLTRPCASQSLGAAEVPIVGAPPIGPNDPAQRLVGHQIRPLEGRSLEERAVVGEDLGPRPREQRALKGQQPAEPRGDQGQPLAGAGPPRSVVPAGALLGAAARRAAPLPDLELSLEA